MNNHQANKRPRHVHPPHARNAGKPHVPENCGNDPPSQRPPVALAEQPDDNGPLLLSMNETARRLSISPRTLWELVNTNAIPHTRIGRRVLFSVRELEAWIAAGTPDHPNAADEVRRRAWGGDHHPPSPDTQ